MKPIYVDWVFIFLASYSMEMIERQNNEQWNNLKLMFKMLWWILYVEIRLEIKFGISHLLQTTSSPLKCINQMNTKGNEYNDIVAS